jgi:mevalonate kinase
LNQNQHIFRASGKLLLTGEYFVLDGAVALALPTQSGQTMQVVENQYEKIVWNSFDANGTSWFQGVFGLPSGEYETGNDEESGRRLSQIFNAILQQKPTFFQQYQGLHVETRLEFPRQWGLGSSSTLLANLARWSGTDAYALLRHTFGGSGYDLACAQAQGPILYQLHHGKPRVQAVMFKPIFYQNLYFIYLGKKQNSREGIARYREKVQQQPAIVLQISTLTEQFMMCKDLPTFESLIRAHESVVSATLELPRAKDLYFQDFPGEIKSLGAWGGDFVLAASAYGQEETKAYFNEKGFDIVIPYESIIL